MQTVKVETIRQKAESYSTGRDKGGIQTYAVRGQLGMYPRQARIPAKTVPTAEPRVPAFYRVLVMSSQRHLLVGRFRKLVKSWKKEVAFESSLAEILMNHKYLKIIGLGPAALPLILQDLQREPDLWFLALESITGEDPAASEENTGDFKKISELWLQWGRERGFI